MRRAISAVGRLVVVGVACAAMAELHAVDGTEWNPRVDPEAQTGGAVARILDRAPERGE